LLWVQGIPGSNPGWAPLFVPVPRFFNNLKLRKWTCLFCENDKERVARARTEMVGDIHKISTLKRELKGGGETEDEDLSCYNWSPSNIRTIIRVRSR